MRHKVERRGLYREWGFRTLPEANAQSYTARFGALYNSRDIFAVSSLSSSRQAAFARCVNLTVDPDFVA
jgi:hypothetical protein